MVTGGQMLRNDRPGGAAALPAPSSVSLLPTANLTRFIFSLPEM